MSSQPAGILPLDQEQTNSLQTVVTGLSPQQLQWVSGYTAGLAAAAQQPASVANIAAANVDGSPASGDKLTVLYGSQTGNGEEIAAAVVDQAKPAELVQKVVRARTRRANQLRQHFLIDVRDDADLPILIFNVR